MSPADPNLTEVLLPSPIDYAESDLGVHKVWDEAQVHLELHQTALEARVTAIRSLRAIRDQQSDRESVLAFEGRAKYSQESATGFERILKGLIHEDEQHKMLRLAEREAQADLETAEAEITSNEVRLRVLGARLTELGGLLTFYAATKLTTGSQVTRS